MNRASLEYAVSHIGRYGDTDVFPFPAENHVFHDQPDEVVALLERIHTSFTESLNAGWTAGVSSMSPAGYTGFRWATQLDPQWNAYLLALLIELAPSIEQARVEPEVVHSHRFSPEVEDHALFERDGYLSFEEATRVAAADHEWVVVTDIADFYQRVYHHRLDNALKDVSGGSDVPWRIMQILGRWSNDTSYGLPVGGPAARLLSELVLTRTDKLLQVEGQRFHRYADDYVLFADSRGSAHRSLASLSDLLLRNEGLALAKSKTRVMSRAEYLSTIDRADFAEDSESDLNPEQRSRRRRARELLGLTLRYDPYSPTAEDDYEALRDAVERIDIVDLFMMELSKPRIDARLTRRLLRALDAADPMSKGAVCSSLAQNLELLTPLVPQVLQALRRVLSDAEESAAQETREVVAQQIADRSHVFELGVNLGFGIRVLADSPPGTHETQFAQLFDGAPVFVQRDIVVAMANWEAGYWLSDKKSQYDSFHPWVQRALLMASYSLGDEGNHWRQAIRDRMSGFDLVVRDWMSARTQLGTRTVPM